MKCANLASKPLQSIQTKCTNTSHVTIHTRSISVSQTSQKSWNKPREKNNNNNEDYKNTQKKFSPIPARSSPSSSSSSSSSSLSSNNLHSSSSSSSLQLDLSYLTNPPSSSSTSSLPSNTASSSPSPSPSSPSPIISPSPSHSPSSSSASSTSDSSSAPSTPSPSSSSPSPSPSSSSSPSPSSTLSPSPSPSSTVPPPSPPSAEPNSFSLSRPLTKNNYMDELNIYTRSNNTPGVLAVHQFMTKHNFPFTLLTFNNFISYFEKTNNDIMLQKVVDDMAKSKVKPNEYTFFHLLSRAHSSKNHDKFDDIVRQMKEVGCKSSIMTFNLRVKNSLTRRNPLADSKSVLEEMRAAGLSPDLFTYTTIITHLAKTSSLSSCFQMIEEMRKNGVKPNAVTYNVLLGAWKTKEEFTQIAEEMKRDEVQLGTEGYNVLISQSIKRGEIEEARMLLSAMEEAGYQPDVVSYNIIIHALAKNNILECQIVLNEMLGKGIQPDHRTFNNIVSGWAIQGQFNKALELLEVMRKKDIAINLAATSIIDNMIRKGHIEQGLSLFDKFQEEGVEFFIGTYNSLMHSLLERKEFQKCQEIVELTKERGIKPDHLTFHARIILTNAIGQIEEGHKILEEMKREKVLPTAFIYNVVLHRSVVDLEKDLEVIQEMKERHMKMDELSYYVVMKKAATKGDSKTCAELMKDLKNEKIELNSRIFNNIILAYANDNNETEVWNKVAEMRELKLGPTDATYTILLDFMYRIKNLDKCISLLEEMETNHIEPAGEWKL